MRLDRTKVFRRPMYAKGVTGLSREHNDFMHTMICEFAMAHIPVDAYYYYKEINGKLFCLHDYTFTTGVLCNINKLSWDYRICFETITEAADFLDGFSGKLEDVPEIGTKGVRAIK